jgi:hypothetical protein
MILNLKEAAKFNKWMRDTVKSLHYADRKKMMSACKKIEALKYNPIN